MIWAIEFEQMAKNDLAKLDKPVAKRLLNFLQQRLASLENPRSIGEALKGSRFGAFWKYRVGDYRIIANIEDQAIRIVVLRIGNRREVYK